MKKNITINLCGRLFQIDEDAYELLQHYVESLRTSFGKEEGGEEIADDIEERIAELFEELKADGIEAITIEHVKNIITRIGKPEELTGEEEKAESEAKGHKYDSFREAAQGVCDNVRGRMAGKKLYRNPKDKMLAGVLSGIGVYTNTDPILWRLLMVLFTLCYGIGIIAYIVLALVIPEAKTPEQLLQMEGKEVTPQNLADVVVETSKAPQRPSLFRILFSILLKILLVIIAFPLMIVCVVLLVGILFVLIATVCGLVLPTNSNIPFSLSSMGFAGVWLHNPVILVIFVVALFLLLLIPVYAIIHMILSMAAKVRPMGVVQRIVWIVLWIVSLCTVVPMGLKIADYHNRYIYEDTLNGRSRTYQGIRMSVEDADFLRQGDWTIVKAVNCDHYTYCGYYNDNPQTRFLDTFNEDCKEVFHVEHKERVEPGVYRLECMARAEGPGTCIFAVGEGKHLSTIPVRSQIDGEYSMGWTPIVIDNIVVSDNGITYGMSSDSTFTGLNCRAKWFSAIDFKLEKIK